MVKLQPETNIGVCNALFLQFDMNISNEKYRKTQKLLTLVKKI